MSFGPLRGGQNWPEVGSFLPGWLAGWGGGWGPTSLSFDRAAQVGRRQLMPAERKEGGGASRRRIQFNSDVQAAGQPASEALRVNWPTTWRASDVRLDLVVSFHFVSARTFGQVVKIIRGSHGSHLGCISCCCCSACWTNNLVVFSSCSSNNNNNDNHRRPRQCTSRRDSRAEYLA